MTGDCGRTNSGYGGIEKRVQISPLHSRTAAPPIPPGGSAFTAQIEEGKGGMTGLLVHPLSPKVIFISAVQSLEVATA